MNRLSLLGLAALAILGVALVACSSSSDTPAEPTSVANEDGGDGMGVAAVCVEGTVDCQDTVVIGDDGEIVCGEGATAPECLGEEPPLEPAAPRGGVAYLVTVDFDETYADASIDPVLAILQSADPGTKVMIQERFPPAAVATINSSDEEFCAVTTEQLMNVAGVAAVRCDLAADIAVDDPDAPVSNP